jgi:hypothetical protein
LAGATARALTTEVAEEQQTAIGKWQLARATAKTLATEVTEDKQHQDTTTKDTKGEPRELKDIRPQRNCNPKNMTTEDAMGYRTKQVFYLIK